MFFFLLVFNDDILNESVESEILDLGKHLLNIITKSEKLCETRIFISDVKYRIRGFRRKKMFWENVEVNEMLLLALKRNSKLDFELKYK